MRLLVVRHAIAMEREEYHQQALREAKASGEEDFETNDEFRPLTLEGIRKMQKNAIGLDRLAGRPSALVSSPLTRAMQTAAILGGQWDDLDIMICEQLKPGSHPEELADWLGDMQKDHPQFSSNKAQIAIVGHEPHLSNLVSWFLAGGDRSFIELKKGGACLIEFQNQFSQSQNRGLNKAQGRLLWHLAPSMLRSYR